MNKKRQAKPSTDVFAGVDAALRRAAMRAREIAAATGTPLVIYHNGKIERRKITRVVKPK